MNKLDDELRKLDESVVNDLMFNSVFGEFFRTGSNENALLNYKISQALNQLMKDHPSIYSIYLVRFSNDYIFGTDGMGQLSSYPDLPFIIKQWPHNPSLSRWSTKRCYTPSSQQACQEVVSMTVKYPLGYGPKGLAIVNIPVHTLMNFIEDFNDFSALKYSYFQITDQNRQSLFATADSATISAKASRQSSVYTSPYSGWTMENGDIKRGWLNSLSTVNQAWAYAALGVTMAGVWLILFLTRRTYRPIQQILLRIRSFAVSRSTSVLGESNEFRFIESVIESVVEQSDDYKKRVEESIPEKRRLFFYELMEGTRPITADAWEKAREQLKLPSLHGRQTAVIVEIDGFASFEEQFSDTDQKLLIFSLTNVWKEMSSEADLAFLHEWISPSKLSILLMHAKRIRHTDVIEMLERFRSWTEMHLPFTITVAVGDDIEDIASVHESNKEALKALEYKMADGANRILLFSEISDRRDKDLYQYLHTIRSIIQQLVMHEDWESPFASFDREIRSTRPSRETIIQLVRFFQFQLQRSLDELADNYSDNIDLSFADDLAKLDSLDKLLDMVKKHLSAIRQQLEMIRRERKNFGLLHTIRLHIDEHFKDPDLSLDYLADRFEIGVKNLSKLFKEEFGENFIDYVTRLRIQHAMELLAATSLPVQEIATTVAYSSSVTFGRVFKRLTGTTPSAFRESRLTD
ncbi:helix-turn-helix domain-containing protein [Paenibacillus pasadenensis]|nr:helix-turn-helix domain-containing protein [Paenibacillus pasadenensis]